MADVEENKEIGPQVQEVFTLKHNGNLYEVGYDELIVLAQKGMDYDRIRRDRDECRQKIQAMEARNEPQEMKAVFLQEGAPAAASQEAGTTWTAENGGMNDEQVRCDFSDLLRRYPEVGRYRSFEALPQGFVEGLEEGLSPVEAWQEYLLARQELRLAMLERERANSRAAAPDVRSSGRYEEDGFVKALFGM